MPRTHFIGIGGAGMSGLAEILLERGESVSGSDLESSAKTNELTAKGALVQIGHSAEHISDDITSVVYSSAVRADNPERIEAERRHIPILRRAEFLGVLTSGIPTIAVAGTHGKTTTASMIAHILIQAGLDPLVAIGASVAELGGKNARAGSGKIAVVEADEYDKSFLTLRPHIAVITTLEAEHLDIYADMNDLGNSFVEFTNNYDDAFPGGYAVVNIDERMIRDLLPRINKKIVTYGIRSDEAKYRVRNIELQGSSSSSMILRAGKEVTTMTLQVAGVHNIANALASIAVAEILALPLETTLASLNEFRGARRRMERIGETRGILVFDDYAHHPTEIRAVLSALRSGYRGKRICAVFEPHTFTRTRDFADEFGKAFAETADELIVVPIYPARENPIDGVTSDLIYESSLREGMRSVRLAASLEEAAQCAASSREDGDIIITLGAGTITTIAPKILALIESTQQKKKLRVTSA